MLAFTIVDAASPDLQDPNGRAIEEIFEIEAGLITNDSGYSNRQPLETHKCTDEDMAKFFTIEP